MIPVVILVTLILVATALIIFAFHTGSANVESDISGTIVTTVTICLSLFMAATIVGYCGMVTGAAGVYDISPIGNDTANVTVNTAMQKFTIRDGFIAWVIISPSLSQMLGFISTCLYGYFIIRVFVGYNQIMKKRTEGEPGGPFA